MSTTNGGTSTATPNWSGLTLGWTAPVPETDVAPDSDQTRPEPQPAPRRQLPDPAPKLTSANPSNTIEESPLAHKRPAVLPAPAPVVFRAPLPPAPRPRERRAESQTCSAAYDQAPEPVEPDEPSTTTDTIDTAQQVPAVAPVELLAAAPRRPSPLPRTDGATARRATPTAPPAAAAPGAEQLGIERAATAIPTEHADRGSWWRRTWAALGSAPAPGPNRLERAELLRGVCRELDPDHSPYTVTTTSLKGGVGKTTVSACLGLALAEHRADRTVAIDANLHAGTLSDRLIPGTPNATVQHLLDALATGADIHSVGDLDRYIHLADRLGVLAGHKDPSIGAAFAGEDYAELIDCLARFFHIVLADCGTGLADDAMRAVLDHTDTLVLVATPTLDAASLAEATLSWLERNDYQHLVDSSIAVLCHTGGNRPPDTSQLRARFVQRCRDVVEIPADPHLAQSLRITPTAMRPATRDAYLTLAAAVIDTAPSPRTS